MRVEEARVLHPHDWQDLLEELEGICARVDGFRVHVGHRNLQRPSRPRDVAHLGYSLAFEVSPGGLDGGYSPFMAHVGDAGLRRRSMGWSLGQLSCM
jgi:hypothetical protein